MTHFKARSAQSAASAAPFAASTRSRSQARASILEAPMLEPPIGAPSLPAAFSKILGYTYEVKHWFIFFWFLTDGG